MAQFAKAAANGTQIGAVRKYGVIVLILLLLLGLYAASLSLLASQLTPVSWKGWTSVGNESANINGASTIGDLITFCIDQLS